jgi:hypothetical protein
MKTYLARFTITDGGHEHTAYGLIQANTLEDAQEYAESQEHAATFSKKKKLTYFDYGDGTTSATCEHVVELTQNQVEVIDELWLTYYMN